MASTSGLTRRRGAGGGGGSNDASGAGGGSSTPDVGPDTSYETGENGHRIAFDPRDLSESAERSKQPKLTLMEEVLLLGIKDREVCPPERFSLSLSCCLVTPFPLRAVRATKVLAVFDSGVTRHYNAPCHAQWSSHARELEFRHDKTT